MTTITDTQAVDMLDTIAESTCTFFATFVDSDFIELYTDEIKEVLNTNTKETFGKICDILGIEKVILTDPKIKL